MDQIVITKAKEILDETNGNICRHCFGRKLSPLLKERDVLKIADDVSKILDIDLSNKNCMICENIFDKIDDSLYNKIYNKIEYLEVEFDSFMVGTTIPKDIQQMDENLSEKLDLNCESIKKEINRIISNELEKTLKKELNSIKQDIVVNLNLKNEPKVRLQLNPLYIEGRYNKLIRGIPQTKWPCSKCKGKGCEACNGTGKQYPESVEELLSERILKETKGYEAKFHGAGREDIDVLMLGSGRPFVLEIKEPKIRNLDLKKLEEEVNQANEGKTQYYNLKFTEKNRKAEIKQSSPDTYKVYKAIVKCDERYDESKLEELKTLNEIKQQTPIRVLRRRVDKTRIKHVKDVKTRIIDDTTFEMIVKTEGGLYIKELISGDEDRTHPNVGEVLGLNAECIELDVLEVSEK